MRKFPGPALTVALLFAALPVAARAADPVPTAEPGGKTLVLWPGGTPGAAAVTAKEGIFERLPDGPLRDRYVEHITRPLITLMGPRGTPNGITLLIVPGGGYVRVVLDKEGFEAADWFAQRGFACAVLRYRLPGDGWAAGPDAPVHDAIRALRVLRARSPAAQRFGVMGFSAGGHLAARLVTEPGLDYAHGDAADALSGRPDFAVLVYPVITTTGEFAHAGSAHQLELGGVRAADLDRYAPHLHVTAQVPRTLLISAADDRTVPVENSLLMFQALRKAGVRSELHVYDSGGHGFGLRGIAGKDAGSWPDLVSTWALN